MKNTTKTTLPLFALGLLAISPITAKAQIVPDTSDGQQVQQSPLPAPPVPGFQTNDQPPQTNPVVKKNTEQKTENDTKILRKDLIGHIGNNPVYYVLYEQNKTMKGTPITLINGQGIKNDLYNGSKNLTRDQISNYLHHLKDPSVPALLDFPIPQAPNKLKTKAQGDNAAGGLEADASASHPVRLPSAPSLPGPAIEAPAPASEAESAIMENTANLTLGNGSHHIFLIGDPQSPGMTILWKALSSGVQNKTLSVTVIPVIAPGSPITQSAILLTKGGASNFENLLSGQNLSISSTDSAPSQNILNAVSANSRILTELHQKESDLPIAITLDQNQFISVYKPSNISQYSSSAPDGLH